MSTGNSVSERTESHVVCCLPREIRAGERKGKEILEAAGLEFLGDSVDPMMQWVVLPEGWHLQFSSLCPLAPTLVDSHGHRRAEVVLRDPNHLEDNPPYMYLWWRFDVITPLGPHGEELAEAEVWDHDDEGGTCLVSFEGPDAQSQAEAWLNEQHPEHNDPNAYRDS